MITMEYEKDLHLHLGYYEGGYDIEGIALKVAEKDEWRVFFDFGQYGFPVPIGLERGNEEPYGVHIFTVSDEQVNNGEVQGMFRSFVAKLLS